MNHLNKGRKKIRVLTGKSEYPYLFSICCLVNRWDEYNQTRKAFKLQGFDDSNSEFLVCDNSSANSFDAYQGIRLFLREAGGRYVVIAHQDAYPLEHARKLLKILNLLEKQDPMWGVVGNAGVDPRRWPSIFGSIRMPEGKSILMKTPFAKVFTLDENALLIRNGQGLSVSADLSGYHFYGLDLCSVAARLGFSSYTIDFTWYHKSHGTVDEVFFNGQKRIEGKLRKYFSSTSVPTTCAYLSWSPSKWQQALCLGRSLFINSFHPRREQARTYLWRSAIKNLLFFPAALYLAIILGPRILGTKAYRMAQKMGLTKQKTASTAEDSP